MDRPDIYRYLDYRRWLSDFLTYLKKEEGVLSKEIALKAEFKSSSYLSMLIKGTRNLSPKTFESLCSALELTGAEKRFLWRLVEFSQAVGMEAKDLAYQEVLAELKARKVATPQGDQYAFFSDWHVIAAFEGMGTLWRQRSLEDQATSLGISLGRMREIMETLKALGLIELRGKEWMRKDVALQTEDETQSLFIRNFHRSLLQKSTEALDALPTDKRFFSGLTLPLTKRNFAKLIKECVAFQKDVHLHYGDDDQSDVIAQFNLQIFPILEVRDRSTD